MSEEPDIESGLFFGQTRSMTCGLSKKRFVEGNEEEMNVATARRALQGKGATVTSRTAIAVTFAWVGIMLTPATAAVAETTATGAACTITGTSASETLNGTAGDDVICGLGGNDTLSGGTGNDTLRAGAGNDLMDLGTGVNEIAAGGAGVDSCIASDQLIEAPSSCVSESGFGTYGMTTLMVPSDESSTGSHSGVARSFSDATADGGTVVATTSSAGRPVVTRLDARGEVLPTFGTGGWVDGLGDTGNTGFTEWISGVWVHDDAIFLAAGGQRQYIAKLDLGTGAPDPAFGDGGLVYLDSALGLSTSSLMGIYSIDVAEDSLYLAYNTMTPSHTFVIGLAELSTTTGATTANPTTAAASLPESMATLDDGSLVAMMADGSARVYAAESGLTSPATVPALDLSAQAGALPGGSGGMKVLSTGTTWVRATVVGSEDTTRSFTGWVHLLNDQPMTVRLEVFDASGSLVVIDENALSIDAALDPESAAGCDTAGIESPVISQVSQEGAVVSVTLTRCDGYYLVTHDFASSTTTVETLATPVGSTTLKPGLVVETTAGRRWLYTQNQLPGSSEIPVTFMRAF